MANRGPLASVLIVDPILVGRARNGVGDGAFIMPPFTTGDGAGTNGGALAGNVVLTVDDLLTGYYKADPNGANRTLTLPSFAAITNGTTGILKGIGDAFTFRVFNAGAANFITVTGVTSVTVVKADVTDDIVDPGNLCAITFVKVSATDVYACCDLFA